MTDDSTDQPAFEPSTARWRTSTFSGGGDCVAVAAAPGDHVAVRDSKSPDDGTLFLTRAEMATWLAAIKAGALDHLVGPDSVS